MTLMDILVSQWSNLALPPPKTKICLQFGGHRSFKEAFPNTDSKPGSVEQKKVAELPEVKRQRNFHDTYMTYMIIVSKIPCVRAQPEKICQETPGSRSFLIPPFRRPNNRIFLRESFQNNVTLLFVGQDFSICTTMPLEQAFQVWYLHS